VYAARGLGCEQNREAPPHLAGDDDFLLITAGKRARCQQRIRRPDIERRDFLERVLHHPVAVQDSPLREMLLQSEDEIVPDRVLHDETAAMSVFGYVGETGFMAVGHAATRDVDTTDKNLSADNRSQTGHRFDQLRLPVSFDAGDAEYLARLHGKADIVDDADTARPDDGETAHG